MSSENDGAEKSHEPTQHKMDEARRKGDVPRSLDLSAAAGFIGLFVAVLASGPAMMDGIGGFLAGFVDDAVDRAELLLGPGGLALAGGIVAGASVLSLPLFLLPFGASLVALVAQRAFVFAPDKIKPKLSRLNILKNFQQKFGLSGLVDFARNLVKMIAVTAALAFYISERHDDIFAIVRSEPHGVSALLARTMVDLLAVTCVVFLVIGLADVLWQNFDHTRKLRMTHQEVRDEYKQTEGDPHMKSQRNARRTALATNRMLQDVPKADVVIVNPTHYSVALRWDRKPGSAPVVVAKGMDEIALRIREIATASNVPIRQDPPTARAIHQLTDIGEEIEPEQYRAVAAAIRFAEALRGKARRT